MNDRWTSQEVVDVSGPAYNVRNYNEQTSVREFMKRAAERHTIKRACDVGCGYGRLTMVLSEMAEFVAGFEREQSFVDEAGRLLPNVYFVRVDALDDLPAAPGSFDFALTFTVLQHLTDTRAHALIEELKRIVGQGSVLIVEETDPTLEAGDPKSGYIKGRSVTSYEEMMRPWQLVAQQKRLIEPGYTRADVGSYMLFCSAEQM